MPALVESPPFGVGVTLRANLKQSVNIPIRNDKLAALIILSKTELGNVLILLPGLFLRERIISSASAEDTGEKNNELSY